MANIFDAVKEAVPVPLAAERYGLKANRAGMVCCPFHDDHTPSLKLNEDYFYCFGCHAGGDVVSLTARLFDLRPYEAASKLAVDFGVDVPATAPLDGSLNRFRADLLRCQRIADALHERLSDRRSEKADGAGGKRKAAGCTRAGRGDLPGAACPAAFCVSGGRKPGIHGGDRGALCRHPGFRQQLLMLSK